MFKPHNRTRRTLSVGLLSVLCLQRATPALAQDAPEPPPAGPAAGGSQARQLDLSEALSLARKNNRDMQAARERLREVHADVERALSALLPRISAQGKYTYNYPEISLDLSSVGLSSSPVVLVATNQLDGYLTASVPLVSPAAYPALRAARYAYQGQQKQVAVTEAQLTQTVASAFFSAAGAEGLVRARAHAIEVTQETLRTASARFQEGTATRLEVTRAELAQIQAQQRLREAKDTRSAVYRALATLLLLREPFTVSPEDPPVDGRAEQELVADALRLRPEVPALEATIRAADEQVRSARWRWAPSLSASGALHVTNATGFSSQVFYSALGLQLDWQLFDGMERDAQRHAAESQAAAARLRLQQLRDTIADDVRTAREQLLTRVEGLAVAERSLRLSQEALDQARLQHGAGTATQLELLGAQDQLVAAEVGVTQARLDLYLQNLTLRRLTGNLPGGR